MDKMRVSTFALREMKFRKIESKCESRNGQPFYEVNCLLIVV